MRISRYRHDFSRPTLAAELSAGERRNEGRKKKKIREKGRRRQRNGNAEEEKGSEAGRNDYDVVVPRAFDPRGYEAD